MKKVIEVFNRSISKSIKFLKKDKMAMMSVIIYLFFLIIVIIAPIIAPYNPHEIIKENGKYLFNQPPSFKHLFGTTNMGRDIFSQLVYGAGPSMLVGFVASFFVVVVGTLIGLFAGYYTGKLGEFLMRLTDLAFGIPFTPFIIVLISFLGPSIKNIIFSISLLLWRDTARIIRAQTLTIRERSFVEAARVSGASDMRIIFIHIMPNILPLSLLYGSLAMGWAILAESSVSFLGLGDPNSMSWGYILNDSFISQAMSRGAFYWIIPPGICIMLLVMAIFFVGRASEEILFPKLKQQ